MTSAILSQNQVPAMLGLINIKVNRFVCQERKNAFECFLITGEQHWS